MKEMQLAAFHELAAILNPHPKVLSVFQAASILLEDDISDWSDIKQALVKEDYVQRLFEFNKDAIKAETIEKLQPLITSPDFTEEEVAMVNGTASSVCVWILAMVFYYKLLQRIRPIKVQTAELNQKLKGHSTELLQHRQELQQSQQELVTMEKVFKEQ